MYGDAAAKPEDQVAGGDLMGTYECLMSDLMSTRAKAVKPLTCSKKGKGGEPTMKVLVEEVRAVKGEAQITLHAKKLANRAGWFGSNSAYFTLSKLREDGHWVLVAKSNTMPKSASPMWPKMTISMARLCNGDLDRPLRLAVEHVLTPSTTSQVGFMDVPVNSLLRPNWEGQLKHPRGRDKTCGAIKSMKPVIVERPTFVEYLQARLLLAKGVRSSLVFDSLCFHTVGRPGDWPVPGHRLHRQQRRAVQPGQPARADPGQRRAAQRVRAGHRGGGLHPGAL